jgi:phosphatidylserine decarboxylase
VGASAAADRPRRDRLLPIAREGYPVIAAAMATALIAWLVGGPVAGAVGVGAAGFVVAFFRDPERQVPPGEDQVVAPADGRVIGVGIVEGGRYLEGPALRISIFMSPLNVHVNRVPVTGVVERVQYHAGRYFRAFAEKASLDNEQNAVVIRDAKGRRICIVQIAGFVARRIVCYLRESMPVARGERLGLIMFGSRADLYLPADAVPRVAVGARVRGNVSVLAELRS